MRSGSTYLVLFGLVGLAMLTARSKTLDYMRGIRAYIGRVRIVNGMFRCDLHIQNPNSQGITVRSVVGDFYVNHVKVGNVSSFKEMLVAGNSDSVIEFDIKPKVLNIFNLVTNMLNQRLRIDVFFDGTINANNQAMPVQIHYSL